jgi:hypothetical protein
MSNESSQREVAIMNKFILDNYPNVNRSSVFPNGISCGNFCLSQIRRECATRKKTVKK